MICQSNTLLLLLLVQVVQVLLQPIKLFRKIFQQLNAHAASIEGDSFHRYTRPEMDMAIRKAKERARTTYQLFWPWKPMTLIY